MEGLAARAGLAAVRRGQGTEAAVVAAVVFGIAKETQQPDAA